MAEGSSRQNVPCVERPELQAFDRDGDGVLSVAEIRAADPDNAQLQELAIQLEATGIPGLRYTGCADAGPEGEMASDEDITLIIARAAVNRQGER